MTKIIFLDKNNHFFRQNWSFLRNLTIFGNKMVIFLQKLMLKLAFLGFQNLNTQRKLIQGCQNNQRGGGFTNPRKT